MTQRDKNRFWVMAAFFEMCERLEISQNRAAVLLEIDRSMLCHLRHQRRKPSTKIVHKMGYLLYLEQQDKSRLAE